MRIVQKQISDFFWFQKGLARFNWKRRDLRKHLPLLQTADAQDVLLGKPTTIRLLLLSSLLGVVGATLSGCNSVSHLETSGSPLVTASLQGALLVADQPISEARVQLYAASTSKTRPAATPLLSVAAVTDEAGHFDLTGKFSCPSTDVQVYAIATGGNPGLAKPADVQSLNLMAALGSCGAFSSSGSFTIDEVTTAAAVYALAPYMKSTTEIGSEDAASLAKAFSLAGELVEASGEISSSSLQPSNLAPATKVYNMAAVLSSCASSEGGTAGEQNSCGTLFKAATVAGQTPPTTVIDAALAMVQHPSSSIDTLTALAVSSNAQSRTTLPTPRISPVKGTFVGSKILTITDTQQGVSFRYTLDGSMPTVTSLLYSQPITLTSSATVQAIAVSGWDRSRVGRATLVITAPQSPAAKLAFRTQPSTLLGNLFSSPVQVLLEDAEGNVVTSASDAVTVTLVNGSGQSGGSLTAQAINGVATFSGFSSGQSGSGYALVAAAGSLPSVRSNPFTIIAAVSAPSPSAPSPSAPSVAAQQADAFVDSIGLNVHFSYYGSAYTTNEAQVLSYLYQLNVRHLRDQMAWEGSTPNGAFYSLHNSLGSKGIKTDYILTSLNYPMSQVAAYPSLVNDMEAVEATNEIDATGDSNWPTEIRTQQASLYAQVHGNASTKSVVVIAPSLAQPENAPLLGDIASISDVGNSHAYFDGWNPGNSGVGGENNAAYFLTKSRVNTLSEPTWVTETGFWSATGKFWGGSGVGETLMATYMPRALLEFWKGGMQRTYQYELADYSSDVFFGLLRADGTPKPAFYAMANLLTLLKDPGSSFTPGSLAYALSGASSQVHQSLFQKRDGSFYLGLWVEAPGMDANTLATLNVPSQNVVLNLGKLPGAATLYQWNADGSITTTSLATSQQIPLTVTQNILFLKLN